MQGEDSNKTAEDGFSIYHLKRQIYAKVACVRQTFVAADAILECEANHLANQTHSVFLNTLMR